MRLVCGSWQIFVECLCISQLSYTKTTKDNGNANLNLNDKLTWGLKRNKVGEKRKVIVRSSFEDAKECLFCLKTSIEDLHEKSLFPYNPSALLRRYVQNALIINMKHIMYFVIEIQLIVEV